MISLRTSRSIMLFMWFATFSTSVYLTARRHTLSDQITIQIFTFLLILGVLTVIVSYVHLKYLSPLSRAREDIPIDVNVEKKDDEGE